MFLLIHVSLWTRALIREWTAVLRLLRMLGMPRRHEWAVLVQVLANLTPIGLLFGLIIVLILGLNQVSPMYPPVNSMSVVGYLVSCASAVCLLLSFARSLRRTSRSIRGFRMSIQSATGRVAQAIEEYSGFPYAQYDKIAPRFGGRTVAWRIWGRVRSVVFTGIWNTAVREWKNLVLRAAFMGLYCLGLAL